MITRVPLLAAIQLHPPEKLDSRGIVAHGMLPPFSSRRARRGRTAIFHHVRRNSWFQSQGDAMSKPAPSPRTMVHRKPQRAHYDRGTIEAIVDAALICQIAFNHAGSVHCLPMNCWRQGDHLYIHSANNSRLAATLLSGECCVSIAHADALVLARSAFRHSMNFRSVVIYGRFEEVRDPGLKAAALEAFIEHISPGRAARVRAVSPAEMAGTRILRIALDEAVAKIRTGGAVNDDDDPSIPVWSGVIPLHIQAGRPQPDPGSAAAEPPVIRVAGAWSESGKASVDQAGHQAV
jgi:nitroimidazol reductase NimA-like FMN-containing flavoprotein (pyridoxamine 5'-phosphate oxidase superfamily)